MKKESKNRNTFIMFLLAFLVAFFVVSVVEVLRSSFAPVAPDVQVASAVPSTDNTRMPGSFADLVDRLKPAVVNIRTTQTVRSGANPFSSPFGNQGSPFERYFWGDEFFERFFGDTPQREFKKKSLGSGFIISSDGYIFTNNHVVEKADKILVKLSNGSEYEAKIIGRDAKTDIALIKIKPTGSLNAVEIGDSDKLRVGEWVLAIGNPFGLEQTVTAGIVSAKGRVIGAGPYDDFIQTDASINPGNSGGPLFNMEGKVVGINTAIVAQGQGIGFAIPVSMAKTILSDLKTKGKVSRGWLGISVQDITEDIARTIKQKDRQGALVAEVFKGDPASNAGIKAGDIIVEINGKKVNNSHDLLLMIAGFHVGDRIDVKFLRDNRLMKANVLVAERTDRTELAARNTTSRDNYGMAVHDITPEIAQYLGLSSRTGVVVTDVREGSPADDVGIQPQDVILQVNRAKIASKKDYLREISRKEAKQNLLLLVKRGQSTFFVALRQ
ncbi:MAG: putative periplasmic serine endoprotease DegP-like precursor [Syntrophus sp. PtaU1.Bin208]|nr:MAG: putative periplasmic serine endoprotease DegP-like precursor [Syntrophus sp. PtaU1.Bin208]